MIDVLIWGGGFFWLAVSFGAGFVFGGRRMAGRFSERHLALEEQRQEARADHAGRRSIRLSTMTFRRGNE